MALAKVFWKLAFEVNTRKVQKLRPGKVDLSFLFNGKFHSPTWFPPTQFPLSRKSNTGKRSSLALEKFLGPIRIRSQTFQRSNQKSCSFIWVISDFQIFMGTLCLVKDSQDPTPRTPKTLPRCKRAFLKMQIPRLACFSGIFLKEPAQRFGKYKIILIFQHDFFFPSPSQEKIQSGAPEKALGFFGQHKTEFPPIPDRDVPFCSF